jgi:membrane protein
VKSLKLQGLGPVAVVRRALSKFGEDDMGTYASALAYQVLFSLFPFIIFLVALLGFLNIPEFFDYLRGQANEVLPAQVATQVNQIVDEIEQPRGGLLSFGILVALWTASAGVRATMNALNVAYGVSESRPMWQRIPLSLLYTVGLAALLIVAAALLIFGPQVMSWLGEQLGFPNVFVTLWNLLRLPVAVATLMLVVALVYYAFPNTEQRFVFITPGSVFAVLVWLLASWGFSLYVQNFADFSATYGSLGAVVVLLFYFYISASVLLFGAEINEVIEDASPEGKDYGEREA